MNDRLIEFLKTQIDNKNDEDKIEITVDTIKNIVEKLEKQEKMIDAMAEFIHKCFSMSPGRVSRALREDGFNDDKCVEEKCTENDNCAKCIKHYFVKKASEEDE